MPTKDHNNTAKIILLIITTFLIMGVGGYGVYYISQMPTEGLPPSKTPTDTKTPPIKPKPPKAPTPSPEAEASDRDAPLSKTARFNQAAAKIEKDEDVSFEPLKYIPHLKMMGEAELKKEKSFYELIGLEEEKAILDDFIQCVKTPSELVNYNMEPLKGLLLYGAPGNGKTTFARALAKELGFSYCELDGAIFQKFNHKEAIEMVEALFYWAHKYAPLVVTIDECEIPMKNLNKTNDQNIKNIVTKFKNCWTAMQAEPDKPVFFVGTTNHLEDIDDAILSRFDYKIEIKSFNLAQRKAFLKIYAKKQIVYRDALKTEAKITADAIASLDRIAETLEAYPSLQSVRQMKALFKKAAILAIKRHYADPSKEENKITPTDLAQALKIDLVEAQAQNKLKGGV